MQTEVFPIALGLFDIEIIFLDFLGSILGSLKAGFYDTPLNLPQIGNMHDVACKINKYTHVNVTVSLK